MQCNTSAIGKPFRTLGSYLSESQFLRVFSKNRESETMLNTIDCPGIPLFAAISWDIPVGAAKSRFRFRGTSTDSIINVRKSPQWSP
jgi:hypothetical protein